MTDPFDSPLRYPGGKGKVLNFVRMLFHENGLVGRDYVEPYAGGAAVALGLLFHEYVGKIWINDLDPAIYHFWNAVLHDSDEFISRIGSVPLEFSEWEKQRAILVDRKSTGIDLGFACFYLNRTNRSGIVKGGIIGGKCQDGPYKLDARFDREKLAARVRKIADRRDRIKLTGLDTAVLLTKIEGWSSTTPFVYLDPPYVVKGADLYRNSYTVDDHRAIATLMSNRPGPWLVSYDDVPLVSEIYGEFRSLFYSLSYSAQDRKKGGEAMFFSSDLTIPAVSSPARISHREIWRHEQTRLAF